MFVVFFCLVPELHIEFAQCDKDADGLITSAELTQVMTSLRLNVKPDEIRRIIQKADLDCMLSRMPLRMGRKFMFYFGFNCADVP